MMIHEIAPFNGTALYFSCLSHMIKQLPGSLTAKEQHTGKAIATAGYCWCLPLHILMPTLVLLLLPDAARGCRASGSPGLAFGRDAKTCKHYKRRAT